MIGYLNVWPKTKVRHVHLYNKRFYVLNAVKHFLQGKIYIFPQKKRQKNHNHLITFEYKQCKKRNDNNLPDLSATLPSEERKKRIAIISSFSKW